MDPVKIVAGGTSGSLGAVAVVYVGGRLGWHLTPEDGAVIVAAATAVCAFVAHNGLVGIARILWSGTTKTAKHG